MIMIRITEVLHCLDGGPPCTPSGGWGRASPSAPLMAPPFLPTTQQGKGGLEFSQEPQGT